MSEVDELFNEPKTTDYKPYDKDEWAAKKKAERTQAFEMVDAAASELTGVEKLVSYLDVQSRFERYSVSNALLVATQRPDATRLADSKTWQEAGAYIKKGEKAITIIEPGEEYKRDDGKIGVSYRVKKVFDIAQTTAQADTKRKRQPDDKTLVKALVRASPVEIRIGTELPENVRALYKPDEKAITVRQGMDGKDIFRALAFEIAHAKLDKGDYSRAKCDLPAFCVAYLICRSNGVEPQKYNLRDLPFSGADAKRIRSDLSTVKTEANSIINTMSQALKTLEAKNKETAR